MFRNAPTISPHSIVQFSTVTSSGKESQCSHRSPAVSRILPLDMLSGQTPFLDHDAPARGAWGQTLPSSGDGPMRHSPVQRCTLRDSGWSIELVGKWHVLFSLESNLILRQTLVRLLRSRDHSWLYQHPSRPGHPQDVCLGAISRSWQGQV